MSAPARLFETTEGDMWRRQHETMADLLAFIDAHRPGSDSPLPAVPWRVDIWHQVYADVSSPAGTDPSGIRADPRVLIEAYAAVLGAEVTVREFSGKTRYQAAGRIGEPQGTARRPRTELVIAADVWAEDDGTEV